ncbi:hypothetical protein HYT05_05095 [Candidatus Kaiserbacteria bacterium]|nr:hypothetical protein [Candidatus Kaiserbacteria bacterium]
MQHTKKVLLGLVILVAALFFVGMAYLYFIYGALNIPRKANTVITASSTLPFNVPAGYVMEVYAADVPDARVMAFDPGGAMIVSEPSAGKVVALIDTDADGRIDATPAVIDGLNAPHGLEFRCRDEADPTKCTLYVAEKDKLVAYEYDARAHRASNPRKLLDLPSGSIGAHSTRSLLFLAYPQEDTLLIAVGSSCNVCEESDDRRAKTRRRYPARRDQYHHQGCVVRLALVLREKCRGHDLQSALSAVFCAGADPQSYRYPGAFGAARPRIYP